MAGGFGDKRRHGDLDVCAAGGYDGTTGDSRYVPIFPLWPQRWGLENQRVLLGREDQSESRFGGPHWKFSPSTFKANVLSSLDGYGLDEDERKRVTGELEEVFSVEDESTACRLLREFKCGDFRFQDSWEITGMAYTYHFRWCLFAIVWAIRQYDLLQSANAGKLQPELKGEENAKPRETEQMTTSNSKSEDRRR